MMGIFTGKPFLFDGKNHGFRLRFSLKPTHWLIVSSIHFFPELPGPDPSAMLESDDPFNLRRFSDRHRTSYGKALEEMKAGQKSHWIWFVFPGFASGSSVSNCSCFFLIIFMDRFAEWCFFDYFLFLWSRRCKIPGFPTPPYVENGVECGSPKNQFFAIRSHEEALAFLNFQEDGVNLRKNYLEILEVLQQQLKLGRKLETLVGEDEKKIRSSLKSFSSK